MTEPKLLASRLNNIAKGLKKEHNGSNKIAIKFGHHRLTVLDLLSAAEIIENMVPKASSPEVKQAPLPLRLRCPSCNEIHIDEPPWDSKPHHTHACQHCGEVWRPAIFDTVGVQFLPGFKK